MTRNNDLRTVITTKLALIMSPKVGGLEIHVVAVNGIVILRGIVQDDDKKQLAEEIAYQHGALNVRNDIRVMGRAEAEQEATLIFIPGLEDSIIRDRVLGDLETDQRVNALMLNVDVAEGTVRLSGLLDDPSGRSRAEEIARQVDGVSDVINEIEIRKVA